MDTSDPRLVFQGAAWKWGLEALFHIILVVIFFWAIAFGVHHWETTYVLRSASPDFKLAILVCTIVWFAVAGSFAFLNICFPPEIVLTREGFSVSGLKKVPLTVWGDVQEFDLIQRRGNREWICCLLKSSEDVSQRKTLRPSWIGLRRFKIAIKSEESTGYVVKTLNDWHRQYG